MEKNNRKIAGHKRRVTVKLTHPNPLFEKWLTEWKLEAEAKDSNLKYSFQHALKSLQKYPIPLESGKECAILKGFGTRICQMLDQRLREYRENEINDDDNQLTENELVSKPKRSRKSKHSPLKISNSKSTSNSNYIPRAGSGGYAILLGLLSKEQEPAFPGFVLKNDLITSAQHYCDKSMTVAEPGTRYTAWSSMKTLLEKDLVRTRGNPAKFSLTEDGRKIALKLFTDNTNDEDDIILNPMENQFPRSSRCLNKSGEPIESCSETFKKSLEKNYNNLNIEDSLPPSKNLPKPRKKSETITKPLDLDDKIDYLNIDYNSYEFNTSPPSKTSPKSSPESFRKCLETNSSEIICLDDDSSSPKSTEHKFEFNYTITQSEKKTETITKYLENKENISDEYIPDSRSNEYVILKKIFLKSQDFSYLGFVLKSEYKLPENVSSIKILLENGLVEEDSNKILITDKGLNVAINLFTTEDFDQPILTEFNHPPSPKVETNEEIIEGILNSPLFKNKFRISNFNFDGIEDNDLPINSPPKSPINWTPRYPESSNKIETIDLDEDIIITENPIFSKIKNKFSDIETKMNNFTDVSGCNAALTDNLAVAEKKMDEDIANSNNSKKINKFIGDSNDHAILSNNEKSKEKKTNKKLIKNITADKESPKEETKTNFDDIIFQPFQFEIILLVDTQETAGSKKSNLNDVTQHELTRYGIKFEIRRLSVGDFAWIARNNLDQELILPYILERKRMDDLSSSIKDGRFHEQKFRLKQCGIQNLIYLVESYGSKDHLGLPFNTLLQAATNTQIQENFVVKFTECHKHSMAYISTFTKQLIQVFKDKTLTGCSKETLIDSDIFDRIIPLMTFSEFNKSSVKNKNVKVRELFMRQLLQIKGLSFEKAMAITEKYPSPLRLRIAYMKNPDYIGEKLLSSIQYSKMNRFIGPVISKSIYQLYTKKLL